MDVSKYDELKREALQMPRKYAYRLLSKHLIVDLSNGLLNWLKIDEEKLEIIREIMTLIYLFMTKIDDILDEDDRRRGFPTTHAIYGAPFTITTSNITLMKAFQLASKLHPDAVDIVLEQVIKIYEGTAIEIHWRNMNKCPTKEMYIKMVNDKSGAFFAIIPKLMQLFISDEKEEFYKKYDFTNFTNIIAVYIQLANDYLALYGKDYNDMKGELSDIAEGKYGFPMIDAIEKIGEKDPTFEYILNQKSNNKFLHAYALEIMINNNCLEETKKNFVDLRNKANKELAVLRKNPFYEKFFKRNMEEMLIYM